MHNMRETRQLLHVKPPEVAVCRLKLHFAASGAVLRSRPASRLRGVSRSWHSPCSEARDRSPPLRSGRRAEAAFGIHGRLHLNEPNDKFGRFWDMPRADLLGLLEATPAGLTSAEAKQRLRVHGPNSLVGESRFAPLVNFLRFFANPLVLILLAASAISIALGDPVSVPAGEYGKQSLLSLHLWDQLNAKLVLGKDVRQVLTYVETGNADAGLIYATDALTSTKVHVIAIAPDSTHDPIVYPAAVVNGSRSETAARTFIAKEANPERLALGGPSEIHPSRNSPHERSSGSADLQ